MISVAVMAHPKREHWVPDLVKSIDADVQVVWDRKNDRWDTGRRSLLAYDPAASHHVVVQDDAIVCRDLIAGLTTAIPHSQFHPVGLYTGTVRPSSAQVGMAVRTAMFHRSSWVKMEGPWWGVGIMVPTEHIPAIVDYGDRKAAVANYDMKISRYYKSQNIDCWYTLPSLVEHRHGDENPSLIPGRTGKNRCAHAFIGADVSALTIDWSESAVNPIVEGTGMVIYRHRRTGKEVYPVPGTLAEQRLAAKPNHWELVMAEPPEPAEPSEPVGVVAPAADEGAVDAAHLGGGWYAAPGGGKVRGRAAAEAMWSNA